MEKVDYKHGTFIIATTDAGQFTYEDYLEWCEDMGVEPGDETSDEYYEWCEDEAQNNLECDMDNIQTCKQYQVPVVITGELGLWDGKHTILPERKDSVYDAVQRCIGRDTNEAEVKWEDGAVVVYAYHHDGCNIFTIRALSKKGQASNAYRDEDYKPEHFKRLPYLYTIGL